ncbi:MAG: hypothetical protein K6F90_04565 [Lachnospiraceae bacterium]|nr:hypothetical protein [Lachnospiraceae bacterium]
MVKRGFVSDDDEKKRVIDSNALVAERIKLLSSVLNKQQAEDTRQFDEDGFSAGLNAENVDLLFADGAEGGMNEEAPPPPPSMPDLEEIQQEADRILEEARAEAAQIVEEAIGEAEANKQAVYEEARSSGHNDGYAEGLREVDSMKAELQEIEAQLRQDYEDSIAQLEPMFIETLTDIYEHIFHVSLNENKEIIFYLIQNTLRNIDGGSTMVIHVSKDDYGFVSMQKKELLTGISNADEIDIVEDMTLKQNEAFIETGAGIFDCSLETELSGLKKMLQLLSFEKNEEQ